MRDLEAATSFSAQAEARRLELQLSSQATAEAALRQRLGELEAARDAEAGAKARALADLEGQRVLREAAEAAAAAADEEAP